MRKISFLLLCACFCAPSAHAETKVEKLLLSYEEYRKLEPITADRLDVKAWNLKPTEGIVLYYELADLLLNDKHAEFLNRASALQKVNASFHSQLFNATHYAVMSENDAIVGYFHKFSSKLLNLALTDKERGPEYFSILRWMHPTVQAATAEEFQKLFYTQDNIGCLWKDIADGKKVPRQMPGIVTYPNQ